ncbi:MAG: hypothetical protein KDA32_06440 [Phycisphaerales bacterium]|nr:hypothetical protein [Phycisphaerales bacterium]
MKQLKPNKSATARPLRLCAIAGITLLLVGLSLSCAGRNQGGAEPARNVSESDGAVAVSLGNLRVGRAPTPTEVAVSEVLFGATPEQPINFVKPVDLRAAKGGLLIADGAMSAILYWRAAGADLAFASLKSAPRAISAIAVAPNGDLLIADAGAREVLRANAAGEIVQHYKPAPGAPFRPAGLTVIGDELWVSNAAGHRIEVFEANNGAWARSIGNRGRGNAEFGIPLGIAALPDGNVAIVDMLNCRVQVLAPDGHWLRDIGGPGDAGGRFGRPRTIAVGPDGVIFISDAATQRVHAFSPEGQSLGAFGGSEGGAAPLVLPAGIAVISDAPTAERVASASFGAKYYVLVAEQLLRPGIRVYAWRGPMISKTTEPREHRALFVSSVANPHWVPDRCDACHGKNAGGAIAPIPADQVDRLCLNCHDGRKAPEEAHPIGRPADSAQTRAPADWPLVDGKLGCLTCHDIQAHCDATARRLVGNAALVRGYEAGAPLASCRQCHVAEQWRVNPHRASDAASCAFCHSKAPAIDAGVRSGEAALHVNDSRVCLGCHSPHADPAPRGHLGAAMRDPYEVNLKRAADTLHAGSLLPLADGSVACYTCHNPHAPGLFLAGSDVGRRAGGDDPYDLRLPEAALCIACHGK